MELEAGITGLDLDAGRRKDGDLKFDLSLLIGSMSEEGSLHPSLVVLLL